MTKTYIFDKKYSTEFNFEDGLTWRSTVYGVQIPDITVCDPNPWSVDKMRRFNVSLDMVSYLLYAYNLVPIPEDQDEGGDDFENNAAPTKEKFQRLEWEYGHLVQRLEIYFYFYVIYFVLHFPNPNQI